MLDVELFYSEVINNVEDYEKADCYFRGAPPEIIANPKLASILGIDSQDFNENYSAIPVKVMADRINLAGFNVPDNDADTELLQQVWDSSLMHLEFEGFIRDTIKYGDGYLEVWTREDGMADICPASPLNSRMIYFAGDIRVKLCFGTLAEVEIVTPSGDVQTVPHVTLKYADRIEQWVKSSNKPKAEWVPYEEDEWEVNPFGEVPAFHFRNETPYGIPAHYDAYGSQNQLIKAIANLMGVLDFAGLPERWALMDATDPQMQASYGVPGEEQAYVDPDALEAVARPGAITLLKAREVGSFEISKTSEFLAVKDSALKSMSALTGTPMRFFADPSGQHPAGDSLRAADLPLRNKIKQHERMYGFTLAEALSFVLEVSGRGEAVLPLVRWEPQVVDADKDLLEAAQMKLALGIPQRQVLAELGYSDSQLDAWELSVEEEKVVSADTDSTEE